eukprot:TRINITY_DN1991_c0_g1_i1.p1 TRINITY_DN1991_c0_g1~~TRINITY_DN1991_c0_g1_i1.p1  ORF type:complete len:353 (-),score=90.78 TRINITY_DN1991_c0_g1_i1:34-1092(-)
METLYLEQPLLLWDDHDLAFETIHDEFEKNNYEHIINLDAFRFETVKELFITIIALISKGRVVLRSSETIENIFDTVINTFKEDITYIIVIQNFQNVNFEKFDFPLFFYVSDATNNFFKFIFLSHCPMIEKFRTNFISKRVYFASISEATEYFLMINGLLDSTQTEEIRREIIQFCVSILWETNHHFHYLKKRLNDVINGLLFEQFDKDEIKKNFVASFFHETEKNTVSNLSKFSQIAALAVHIGCWLPSKYDARIFENTSKRISSTVPILINVRPIDVSLSRVTSIFEHLCDMLNLQLVNSSFCLAEVVAFGLVSKSGTKSIKYLTRMNDSLARQFSEYLDLNLNLLLPSS